MSTVHAPARRVRWFNYLAYGSNDVLGAGSMAVTSTWILLFYTSFCGLSASQATIIFGVARVLDAIASPTIGYFSDRIGGTALARRFGKRRIFILAAIPLMPSFALMWVAGQGFYYYLVTYVLFELVYALEIIPYETLASEMATDYSTKAKLAGSRILCGQMAAIAAAFVPGWLIGRLGPDSPNTYLYLGAIFSALFMLTAGSLYLLSWERARPPGLEEPDGQARQRGLADAFYTLYHNLLSTMRVRSFRLHLGMYLGGYLSQDIYNATFTYFVIFALAGSVSTVSSLVGVTFTVQLVAVGLAILLTLRLSPAATYRLAALSFAVGVALLVGMYLAGLKVTSPLFWLPILFAGLGRGALNYIPWATYNYMADVDEIVTGRRRDGAFAGVMTFVRKLSQAVAVMLVGQVMEAAGFVSKASVQHPAAIAAITLLLSVGTLALLAFGIIVSLRFRLNPQTHAILVGEVERLRQNPAAEPSSQSAKDLVEDLSGWRFEQLWGRNSVARA